MGTCIINVGVAATLVLWSSGCLARETRAKDAELLLESEAALNPPAPPSSKSESSFDDDDASLGKEARLDTILRLALARNPDLLEARDRAKASAERAPAAARLPDLEFNYEQWGIPLGRPYALGEASTLMFGLRQSLPALGSLNARSRAALEEAKMGVESYRGRAQDLIAQVRRAYFEYFRANADHRIHLNHVEIATRVVDLARANYRAGRGTQQDVLRTLVELSQLHNNLAAIEQQLQTVRALLNTLMARPVDALLGPPLEVIPTQVEIHIEQLQKKLEASRPELAAAAFAVRRSEASLEATKRSASWPVFMVGADYWLMPKMETQHAYAAMVSMSLPWLNPRHREEIKEAEHILAADRRALESVRNVSQYQLREAVARYRAAQQSFDIINRDVLPQATQSYESAQSAFAVGQGDAVGLLDALRSLLQVRLEHSRAVARLESALADVERAVGTSLETSSRSQEGAPTP